MCLFHGFVMLLVQQLTHLTVAGMAVERLLAICHGYLYERLVTHSRCWYLLASTWVFSVLVSLMPVFGLGELCLQYPFTWCYVNIHLCHTSPLRHQIFTIGFGVLNACCLTTMVICNLCVVGSLLRMRLSRQVPAHLSSGRRPSVQRDQELQMVFLLIPITIVFVVSWLPIDIILMGNLLRKPHVTKEDHRLGDLVPIRLVSYSQILDPWFYIFFRMFFSSKFWNCCRRAVMGRRWSMRRSSHSTKIKSIADESQSEPSYGPPQPAPPPAPRPAQDGVCGAPGEAGDTALDRGTQPATPVWQGTLAHITPAGLNASPHHPDAQQNASTIGEGAPLARSISLAIPIPLFICEHYSMEQQGHVAPCPHSPDPAMLATGQQGLRARSCCLDHHLPLPSVPGVLRSYSWGCRAEGYTKPHHRSCSTQTLPGDVHTAQHALTPTQAPATTPPGQ